MPNPIRVVCAKCGAGYRIESGVQPGDKATCLKRRAGLVVPEPAPPAGLARAEPRASQPRGRVDREKSS